MRLVFSDCNLDLAAHELRRGGQVVPVEPQVFDVLRVLAERAGNLVSKDEMIDLVWDGRIVSEATISARISSARAAVGDNGRDQGVIRTVSRRGFQMVVEVSRQGADTPERAADLQQIIRYTTSQDGGSLAWSSAGEGPPVLFAWHHLCHLEQDWGSPFLRPMLSQFAERHRLVRFDIRGAGLSDPLPTDASIETHAADLIAVADAAGLERFPIVASLQAAAVAVHVAAQVPDRVSRLVLLNGYARGRAVRPVTTEPAGNDLFVGLLQSGGWGDPSNGFMRAWITMVLPMASSEEVSEIIRLVACSGSAEEALKQRSVIDYFDIMADLPNVRAPTRVIHARLCSVHPVGEGRKLAAGIPEAEFLEVDSSNTFLVASDPCFDRVMSAALEFLA